MGRKLPFSNEVMEIAEHHDSDEAQKLLDAVERNEDDNTLFKLARALLNRCIAAGMFAKEEAEELLEPSDEELEDEDKVSREVRELVDGADDDEGEDFDMVVLAEKSEPLEEIDDTNTDDE